MPIVTSKTARRAHACERCREAKHRCEGGVVPAVSAALVAKNPDNLFLLELARREAARLTSPAGSSSPGPRSDAVIIATATARLRELNISLAANPADEGLRAQRAAALDDLEAASARVLAADTASSRKRARKD
jgi:hypothetical protein